MTGSNPDIHDDGEPLIYQLWEDGGYFAPKVKPGKDPFLVQVGRRREWPGVARRRRIPSI